MKDLLVVVDMVNGFVNEGALADKNINRITPNIIKKIKRAKAKGDLIVAFKDCHSENDEEFKFYPPHCIKGTSESELISELKPYENDMVIIEKNTTNGFKTAKMGEIMAKYNFENIDITGCCTDICVSDFTHSLIEFMIMNGINSSIHIDENCVDTFGGEGHEPDKVNKQTLKELEELGVEVLYKDEELKPIKIKKLTDRRFLNMFEVTYQGEHGEIRYEMCTRHDLPEVVKPTLNPDAVHVLPYSYVNGSMVVYLIKEFRYPVGKFIYAIPAGLVDKGESGMTSAIREVNEEIGAEVVKIQRAETSSYSSVGMTDEKAEIYEAEVKMTGKQHLVGNEKIEVVPVKLEDIEGLLDKENFGARSKLSLRNFVYKQKIKELEGKLEELEREDE